jgi:hypothetical protein
VLIRLLQGFIYTDERAVWDMLLRYQSLIHDYFSRMGLDLYVDEANGFAYLSQPESAGEGDVAVPRLTRRRAFSFGVTVILVVLREALNNFERNEVDSPYLVLEHSTLLDMMRPFYPAQNDERKQMGIMQHDVKLVVEMGFLKEIKQENHTRYIVRPILKAKLASEDLEAIKAQLSTYRAGEGGNDEED